MKQGLVMLVVLAFGMTLAGQVQNKGRTVRRPQVAEMVSAGFSDSDRRAVKEWVQGLQPADLPAGLVKRGDLPPGLQKQLQKNGTLPLGMEKRASPFPEELTKRLEALPAGCGCDRVFLEGRALIVARSTGSIFDVISLF